MVHKGNPLKVVGRQIPNEQKSESCIAHAGGIPQTFTAYATQLTQHSFVKPEETLVEARSGTDVQIVRQIWV